MTPVGGPVAATGPGCVTVDESSGAQPLAVKVGQPTVLPFSTTAAGQFVIRIAGSPSPDTALKVIDLEPGSYELHLDLPDTRLDFELPGQGSTRVCGLAK